MTEKTLEKPQEKSQETVYTVERPEYPRAVYNHETRETKSARDKEERDKLSKEGFTDEPLPPLAPESLTPDEVKQLQELLSKAAKALAKLGELSHQQTKTKPITGKE